jgi:hypothetical protein
MMPAGSKNSTINAEVFGSIGGKKGLGGNAWRGFNF